MSEAAEDWRLTDQQDYLMGVTLYWKRWTQTRPNWDHDHCAFCWAQFCNDGCGKGLPVGYTDKVEYTWICKQCFDDFRELFKWSIGEVTVGMRLSMFVKTVGWRIRDVVIGEWWRRRKRTIKGRKQKALSSREGK